MKGVVRTKGRWKGGGCGSREKGEGGRGTVMATPPQHFYIAVPTAVAASMTHTIVQCFFLFNKLNFDGLLH